MFLVNESVINRVVAHRAIGQSAFNGHNHRGQEIHDLLVIIYERNSVLWPDREEGNVGGQKMNLTCWLGESSRGVAHQRKPSVVAFSLAHSRTRYICTCPRNTRT